MDKTNNKEVRIVRLRRRKKEEKKPEPQRSAASEALSVVLMVLAVFLLLSLASYYRTRALELPLGENLMGVVGARAARILTAALGWCSFVTVLWAALLSRSVWLGMRKPEGGWFYRTVLTGTGSLAMALSCAMGASVFWGMEGGGRLGVLFESRVHPYVNTAGTLLIASLVFILSLGVATGLTISDVMKSLRYAGQWFGKTLVGSWILSTRAGKIFFRTNIAAGKTALKVTGATARVMGRAVIAGARRAPQLRRKRRKEEAAKQKAQKFLPMPVQSSEPAADTIDAVVVETDNTRASFDEKELRILRSGEEDAPSKKARFPLGRKRLKGIKVKREEKKKAEAEQFALPPVDFLVKADSGAPTAPKDDEIIRNCRQLERALTDFHIGGKIVEVQPGPVITLYQFEPAPGIKVNRIVNLADDLALALKTSSVRVYAPVPGKGTVGIEVPNVHREVVRLRDILDCQKFNSAESALTLALGKDTFGEPFVADLAKMPHLLIAGATGTGKSVCINSLLLSLLYRSTPADLRLILIDPKMLELSVYEEIPHLKAPVVTDPKHARGVFWWAVEEMERRYRTMAEFGVRSIEGYNKLAASADGAEKLIIRTPRNKVIELEERDVVAMANSGEADGIARESGDYTDEPLKKGGFPAAGEALPRIVIVVDELADLMLTSGRECEDLVTRLAQKARAAGIHLILATQRPSVNVITGLIKANFPSRISFKVASRIDSRTVLDSSGAEKLLGQGDMLFMTSGAGRPKRIHSAFVSDKEVHDVVNWLREQGAPDYDPQIEEMIARLEETEKGAGIGSDEEAEYDPLYDQAVNLVVEKGQASTSMVQRVFRIGYNRAARILETMEREGVVGPADGAKPRQVLVPHRDGLA